jgi:hypothetical protein
MHMMLTALGPQVSRPCYPGTLYVGDDRGYECDDDVKKRGPLLALSVPNLHS